MPIEKVQIEPFWFDDQNIVEVAQQLQTFLEHYPFRSKFAVEYPGIDPKLSEIKAFLIVDWPEKEDDSSSS